MSIYFHIDYIDADAASAFHAITLIDMIQIFISLIFLMPRSHGCRHLFFPLFSSIFHVI